MVPNVWRRSVEADRAPAWPGRARSAGDGAMPDFIEVATGLADEHEIVGVDEVLRGG